jgi:hypothetical protein
LVFSAFQQTSLVFDPFSPRIARTMTKENRKRLRLDNLAKPSVTGY